jgi:predicted regulator of Ras-like GTPase activity (Roadblock/LC7/MglB family)
MPTIAEALDELVAQASAQCAALVDSDSGMILGQSGYSPDMEIAAAGNTEVIRSQMKSLRALGQDEVIDDILITLSTQYDILRPLKANPSIFLYVTLDKAKANLALARFRVSECEAQLAL